jgi:tetratricopeptide (TPR) repeat protein
LFLSVWFATIVVVTVDWNEQYGKDPAWDPSTMYATGSSSMITVEEEQIQQVEQALNEYHDLLMDGEADTIILEEMEEAVMMEDYYYVEKSNAYEGDLHNKLGTLYLNRGDHVLASSHLQEAIRLYELDGEQDEINMASAKYNLSLLHLRAGEYQNSANLYSEALDIFKTSIGEGLNPLSSDFDILEMTNLVRERATKKNDNTKSSHQSNEKPKNNGEETTDQTVLKETLNRQESPKVFVDLENFLKQNESIKEEL